MTVFWRIYPDGTKVKTVIDSESKVTLNEVTDNKVLPKDFLPTRQPFDSGIGHFGFQTNDFIIKTPSTLGIAEILVKTTKKTYIKRLNGIQILQFGKNGNDVTAINIKGINFQYPQTIGPLLFAENWLFK